VVYDSAARAILPQVVDRGRLDGANSWLTVEETVGQDFVGPPVGAGLFGWLRAAPFIATAIGFAAAALLVLAIPGRFRTERAERTTLRADIRDGLRWLWRHPLLRGLTVLSGLIAAFMSMATSLTVLYALRTLHLDPSVYGFLFLAMGIGGLVGSFAVAPLAARLGRPRMITIAAGIAPVMFVLLGTITDLVAATLWFFGLSVGVTMWNVLSMSLRQAMIPADLLGRVLGAHRVALWGGIPLGAVVGGFLAERTSVPAVFLVSGIAQLVVVVLVHRLVARNRLLITGSFDQADEPAARSGGDRAKVARMTSEPPTGVLGVGYEGLRVDEFVENLTAAGVDVVVDVRLTPLSRKRGFSKRSLDERLQAAGIRYEHLRALGNPTDNRAGFGGDAGELSAALARYEDLLADPDAAAALDQLARLATRSRVAVLCFEASDERCHRQVVLARVRERLTSG
jgi:Protein of unknown function, DUF488/Transmembrane secretion effector